MASAYAVTIKKQVAGYKWVNTYKVGADSLAEAYATIEAFQDFEATIHLQDVQFVSGRVNRIGTENTEDFIILDWDSEFGEQATSSNGPALPWNAALVNLAVANGHPGRKMYRYVYSCNHALGNGDGGEWVVGATLPTIFATAAADLVTTLAGMGNPMYVGGVLDSLLAAREVQYMTLKGPCQLDVHHGWYNRATPGG